MKSKRPGYQNTLAGWIPEDWQLKRMHEIGNVSSGGTPDTTNDIYWNGNINWCTPTDITALDGNKFLGETKTKITEAGLKNSSAKLLPVNSLIVCTRATIGKVAINKVPMSTNQGFKNIVVSGANLNYLYYRIQFDEHRLIRIANGSTFLEVSKTDFDNFPIPLPCNEEQDKIATVLTNCDDAIMITKKLIVHLKCQNRALMHELLTGKRRLKGYNKPWREIHLGSAFDERNEIGFVNLDLLSVGSLGVYPQSQSEKRDTSNSDKAKYKRICPGDIGYNTMRMWQGRSALSSLEGIVSPAYTIVTPKEQQHSQFYAYLFKLPSVVNKFFRNSQGLVEDTLNCKFKDFALVKVEVPEYEEQVAIANLLTTAQAEIKSYERKLNALQQQKKGLMQKLLTGDVRVKTHI